MPRSKTQYQRLLEGVSKAAEAHPGSYIVLDAKTHALLGSGEDPHLLYQEVRKALRPGQVPVVYKRPAEGEILILSAVMHDPALSNHRR